MQKYAKRDFEALKSIYDFRCLSLTQLFELHYKSSKGKSQEYARKKFLQLKQDKLVEEYKSTNKNVPSVFFLTNDGIKAVKNYFGFANNIYDADKKMLERGYFTYAEIKIANRFVPHQYFLNDFGLEAIKVINQHGLNYTYKDERHLSEFYGIRPDAILSFEGIDLFLEMDMGTETVKQLKKKWNHYRTFLNSPKFIESDKKVVILFICNNKGRINERIDLIKHSINENFIDCLKGNIELYVGVSEKLISVIKNILIPNELTGTNDFLKSVSNSLSKNFKIASGVQMSKYLNNVTYTYFIKNETQEFLVQEFFGEPMTTMNRMAFHSQINSFFRIKFNKDIPLLVVSSTEDMILKNIDLFDVEMRNIYFTTMKRLETMPFHEAVFIIRANNQLFSYEEDFIRLKPTKKLK